MENIVKNSSYFYRITNVKKDCLVLEGFDFIIIVGRGAKKDVKSIWVVPMENLKWKNEEEMVSRRWKYDIDGV